jgi:hypothetical protein
VIALRILGREAEGTSRQLIADIVRSKEAEKRHAEQINKSPSDGEKK